MVDISKIKEQPKQLMVDAVQNLQEDNTLKPLRKMAIKLRLKTIFLGKCSIKSGKIDVF